MEFCLFSPQSRLHNHPSSSERQLMQLSSSPSFSFPTFSHPPFIPSGQLYVNLMGEGRRPLELVWTTCSSVLMKRKDPKNTRRLDARWRSHERERQKERPLVAACPSAAIHTHACARTPNDPLQGFIFPRLTVVFISTPVALCLDCMSLKNNPNLPEEYAAACLSMLSARKQLKEPSNRQRDSRKSTSSLPGNRTTSRSVYTEEMWPRQDNRGKNELKICVTFVQIVIWTWNVDINQGHFSNKCWDRKKKRKLPHYKSR